MLRRMQPRGAGVVDAPSLGLMAGPPPIPEERRVTLANWQDPPFNRWGFTHIRDLIPTARIARGEGAAWRLPRAERDLSRMRVRSGRRRIGLERWLDETYTDALLVLHRGRVVTERYRNAMTPSTTHLLMSVSKSITSSVAGILVGRGQLDPSWPVTQLVPELAGTSFDGCTVRHLLDMRAGTRFNEDYDDLRADVRVYEQIYLWRPRTSRKLPDAITDYYRTLRNARPHGGMFDYRSVLTDVLGWVIERAGGSRFAELCAELLWAPMGAEFDAEVTVDAHGNAMVDGGICCTLRDLARFGQLILAGGRRAGRQVVPRAWIRDTLTPEADSAAAFAANAESRGYPSGAFYRNQWWIVDPRGPVFTASGINGQSCFVHAGAGVVIAKLSTWPVAWSDEFSLATWPAMLDLARQIDAGGGT
jgi:CubicO group peptidase (beta-lactamase class C family)